jgi:hypothetical protein
MHLISDNSNMQNNEELVLFDTVFCQMVKLSCQSFVEKWKNISKKYESIFSLGKFFSSRESSVIKRLQANNIMVCSFKSSGNTTYLYLCCTSRDNTLIVAEMKLINCDGICGTLKYKSERLTKESELELFVSMILCENDSGEEDNNEMYFR